MRTSCYSNGSNGSHPRRAVFASPCQRADPRLSPFLWPSGMGLWLLSTRPSQSGPSDGESESPYNAWFLGPRRVRSPNGISRFRRLTVVTNGHAYTWIQTDSVRGARSHLCYACDAAWNRRLCLAQKYLPFERLLPLLWRNGNCRCCRDEKFRKLNTFGVRYPIHTANANMTKSRNHTTPWVKKKQDTKLLPITSPNINRYSKNSFTVRLTRKFATKSYLNTPTTP